MVLGMRVSKFAQTSPKKIDYHVYPSGTKVIKAFVANDFVFYDSSGDVMLYLDKSSIPHKVKFTLRIQKNPQNGQSITVSSNIDHPQVCPVRAVLNMVLRARCLGQPDLLPVACFSTKKGARVHLIFISGGSQSSPSESDQSRIVKIFCSLAQSMGLCAA